MHCLKPEKLWLYSICANRGYGKYLLKEIETIAIKNGCNKLKLEVRQDNLRAINFYLKNGFTKIGEIANYYEDGEVGLKFTKSLKTPIN